MAKASKKTAEEIAEAKTQLLAWLKPGDTVYTILRHVSSSGMMRRISPIILLPGTPTPDIRSPEYSVNLVLSGKPPGAKDGIVMHGCGMDMGFELVYQLSYHLFKEGWKCLGPDCHSSEHRSTPTRNEDGTLTYHPGPEKDGIIIHSDGGYALKQRWL